MRNDDGELSMECKMLMIHAFQNVCRDADKAKGSNDWTILKTLFIPDDTGRNGIGIIDQWRREATTLLKALAENKEGPEWYQDVVAYRFLIDYTKFVKDCFVVKTRKCLDKLKDDFGVEWNQPNYLHDVSSLCVFRTSTQILCSRLLCIYV